MDQSWRPCDLCGKDVFPESGLQYNDNPPRECLSSVCGQLRDYALFQLGDWGVLCEDCSMRHSIAIINDCTGEKVNPYSKATEMSDSDQTET